MTDKRIISFKEFLKKYTTVNNSFVDEYYSFYEMCKKETCGICLDGVIKYLGIKVNDSFYKNIKKKYTEKLDYRIINKKYYISFDTFERICMESESKKADEIREYFLSLRKFIQYYNKYIAEMINQSAIKNPAKCVYLLIVDRNKNIFKYGISSEIKKRLHNYANGKEIHPYIKFIALVEDKKIVENVVKSVMPDIFGSTKIYKTNINMLKSITFDSAELNAKINELARNSKMDSYFVFDDSPVALKSLRKLSRDLSRKSSHKSSRKTSRKLSRKTSRKTSRKLSRKLSRKTSRKLSRKLSRKISKRY